MRLRQVTNPLLMLVAALTATTLIDAQDQVSYYAEAINNPLLLNFTEESGNVFSVTWSRINRGVTTQVDLYTCQIPGECYDYTADVNGGYSLESVPPVVYNLNINNLDTVTSTKYSVSANGATKFTGLYYTIALEPLSCPDPGNEEFADGTQVEITCIATYYQYLLDPNEIQRPILDWSNDLGYDFSSQAEPINYTDTNVIYTINVTLTGDYDDVPFICNLAFPTETGLEYNDTCEVTYYVIHGVSQVDPGLDTTEGIPDVVVGDVLNCTANGRPPPTITWLDENGALTSDSFELVITGEMANLPQPVTYSCVATNTLPDGSVYEASSNVTFRVNSEIIVKSGGVEAWVIAVAVCVPLVVIIAGGIGGYFFYRHRRNKKAKKTKSGSTNGNATTYTAVSTNPDPYPARPPVSTTYSQPVAAQRVMTPQVASGATTPGGAGGYGALGVQYYTGSNTALNASINSNTPSNRPAYPYNPRQGAAVVNLNPNPSGRPTPLPPSGNPTYPYTGRQPSVMSSSSSGSSYHQPQPMGQPPNFVPPYRPSQASSVSGSEV